MMTASQLVTLKTNVDKEMKRRCYNGSMTAYAGSSYAFQTAPAAGSVIQAQQGNAVIQPLNAVSPIDGLSTAATGEVIPAEFDNDNLTKVVNDLSSMTTTTASPGCAASCSGLCHTQCSTTCYGCSGCSTSCSGCSGCSGTCYEECMGSCWDTCSDTCSENCIFECKGSCSGDCQSNCAPGCNSGCKSCNGCSGCTGSQSSTDCGGNCSGTCTSSCGACTGCSGLTAYT